MKTARKAAAVLLTIVLLMILTVPALAADAGKWAVETGAYSGDYRYDVMNDGSARLSWYSGSEANLVIPATLGGHPVRTIGQNAFEGCRSLVSVVIPEGVTFIDAWAFYKCSSLQSVSFPDSLKTVGAGAFENCTAITSISIPANVELLDREAFCLCRGLQDVTIPSSVKTVADRAFKYCTQLKSATLSEGVRELGEEAFCECTALDNVSIPKSVTAIGKNAFARGSAYLRLHVNGNTYAQQYAVANGIAYDGGGSAEVPDDPTVVSTGYSGAYRYDRMSDNTAWITGYSGSDEHIFLPATLDGYPVSAVGEFAFGWNDRLKSVVIPDTVTRINGYAFFNCYHLEGVTIPKSVASIGGRAFSGSPWQQNHPVSDGWIRLDNTDHYVYAGSGGAVTVPAAARTFDLDGKGSVTSVSLPAGMTAVPEYAFAECGGLSGVTLPEGLQKVGVGAFQYDYSLKALTIPEDVKIIGRNAFAYCTGLTLHVVAGSAAELYAKTNGIPYTYSAMGDEKDFAYQTTGAGTVQVTGYLGTSAVVSIPAYLGGCAVTSIGNRAFMECGTLVALTIPEGVTSIGVWAFRKCTALSSVSFPESLKVIGNGAFDDCFALKSVTLPPNLTEIGNEAFVSCNAMTDIAIPGSVKTIGERAFKFCGHLKTVTIADGTLTIGQEAFRNCVSLTVVTIPGSVSSIGKDAFADTNAGINLHVSSGSYAQTYAAANGLAYTLS